MNDIHELEEEKKPKSPKVNIRITPNLKQRYENALERAGISMTQHLTSKILEFVQFEENRMKEQEDSKIEPSSW